MELRKIINSIENFKENIKEFLSNKKVKHVLGLFSDNVFDSYNDLSYSFKQKLENKLKEDVKKNVNDKDELKHELIKTIKEYIRLRIQNKKTIINEENIRNELNLELCNFYTGFLDSLISSRNNEYSTNKKKNKKTKIYEQKQDIIYEKEIKNEDFNEYFLMNELFNKYIDKTIFIDNIKFNLINEFYNKIIQSYNKSIQSYKVQKNKKDKQDINNVKNEKDKIKNIKEQRLKLKKLKQRTEYNFEKYFNDIFIELIKDVDYNEIIKLCSDIALLNNIRIYKIRELKKEYSRLYDRLIQKYIKYKKTIETDKNKEDKNKLKTNDNKRKINEDENNLLKTYAFMSRNYKFIEDPIINLYYFYSNQRAFNEIREIYK